MRPGSGWPLCHFRAHAVPLAVEDGQSFIEQITDLLPGAASEPGEHGGVEGSEGDRGQDLRAHIMLRVQSEADSQRIDHGRTQVFPIDPFLLAQCRSLGDQAYQNQGSIAIGGGQLPEGLLHGSNRILARGPGDDIRGQARGPLVQKGKDDILLRAEVTEESSPRHPRSRSQVLHRGGIEAAFDDQGQGGL